MIPLSHYLGLSVILFTIGVLGVVIRRNAIVIFMCIELMLNGANLSFVALSRHYADAAGQMFVFFILAIAAAEAAVGLAIVISLFRNLRSIRTDDACNLHG